MSTTDFTRRRVSSSLEARACDSLIHEWAYLLNPYNKRRFHMDTSRSACRRATSQLLTEIFDGPPEGWVYLLNPGDPGLLGQLDTIGAELASKRPAPGRTTIAAQVNHIRYSLALLNRWAAGEENPWENADWEGSWEPTNVTEDEWRTLREDLRREATSWRNTVDTRTDWGEAAATTVLSSAVHTAYHLGALRQILLFLEDRNGP